MGEDRAGAFHFLLRCRLRAAGADWLLWQVEAAGAGWLLWQVEEESQLMEGDHRQLSLDWLAGRVQGDDPLEVQRHFAHGLEEYASLEDLSLLRTRWGLDGLGLDLVLVEGCLWLFQLGLAVLFRQWCLNY